MGKRAWPESSWRETGVGQRFEPQRSNFMHPLSARRHVPAESRLLSDNLLRLARVTCAPAGSERVQWPTASSCQDCHRFGPLPVPTRRSITQEKRSATYVTKTA